MMILMISLYNYRVSLQRHIRHSIKNRVMVAAICDAATGLIRKRCFVGRTRHVAYLPVKGMMSYRGDGCNVLLHLG